MPPKVVHLTFVQKKEILARWKLDETLVSIARAYGVSHSTIAVIVQEMLWFEKEQKRKPSNGNGKRKIKVAGDFPPDMLYLRCSTCKRMWWQAQGNMLECGKCAGVPEIVYRPVAGEQEGE